MKLGLGLGLAASFVALAAPEASARTHSGRHHHHIVLSSPANGGPPFAAIVVDENTGREIYGVNENALRHPASITKVMTLYLLFEKLAKGEMKLDSEIRVSEHAAAQQPSKLGVAPGDTLSVEDAIKAVVTRSANDVAVAIAESIGGDEATFAAMMTRKAHALGMSRTLYRNASGLPNDEQWTTARDLTVLARSLEERFPQYFHYFSTHEFTYDGEVIGNHNHLLGRVAGVDGIKTGYTNASGFNLLTSVHRDGRSIVAVVMGGRTAAARDRTMENLIETHIAAASSHGHSATAIADNESPVTTSSASVHRGGAIEMQPQPRPQVAAAANEGGEGDNDDETATTAPAAKAVTSAQKPATTAAKPVETKSAQAKPAETKPTEKQSSVVASTDPASLGWKKGAEPASKAKASSKAEETRVARSEPALKAPPAHAGWIVQIGVGDSPSEAQAMIDRARGRARPLASARPFTERVMKDGDAVYRARFAGLDEASAAKACKALKRSRMSCFITHVD